MRRGFLPSPKLLPQRTNSFGFLEAETLESYSAWPPLIYGTETDGVNDRLESSFTAFGWPATGVSFGGWVKFLSVSGNRMWAGTTATYGGNGLHVYTSGTTIRVVFPNSPEFTFLSSAITSRPYHLFITLDSTTRVIRAYVDGLQVATTTLTVAQMPTSYAGHFFSGAGIGLGHLRLGPTAFYTRVLSASEVAQLARPFVVTPRPETDLAAFYNFAELLSGPARTPDLSVNLRHLPHVNMVAEPRVLF